ncbi:YcfL family protein [Pseudomonas sp. 10B1]|uniref:YcfL family protein n=1 Tax=unclassified Pseudomonas TaxID=196821 RepID=UPI002AB3AC36|nr:MULTISPECIES: YcfL family protein [unclassified Pseudomonas]MDY7562343.1 YcfL family protein [Pseudomonas sp. AB6]MEA9994733.1 YcfL family protein [Pseudomonas sp. AA4]MEB0086396.1 YcfL family protein [Pseudomonas sp. RTI1]MEB0126405.1 YcfL family protein [Pseudomonas sp. CCC1.2]MEB0155244.1 YcfL family protein [Pseudomonas sp. CCC4.3]
MRIKIFGLMAVALLVGCATPPPPPVPGSAASKIVAMGKLKNIDVGAMRVARENGFLTVKAALSNASSSNTTFYYRFAWLDNDGFPVADEETWKSQTLYGSQTSVLTSIAPVPRATDFRIEVKTP